MLKIDYDFWSSLAYAHINRYTCITYFNIQYKNAADSSLYSGWEFANLTVHEFGHTMGIGGTYGVDEHRKEAPSWTAPDEDLKENSY